MATKNSKKVSNGMDTVDKYIEVGDEIHDLQNGDLGLMPNIRELQNQTIVIREIEVRESSFYDGSFGIVTVNDGERFSTSSKVLIDSIMKIKEKLPVRCRIVGKTSKSGMTYLCLQPA